VLARSIKKSDKAATRYEKARAKIPKEKVLSIERVSDKPDGGSKMRLCFRERDKPLNGKLTHALDRPGREAALLLHSEVRKSEGDNVGVEAAHSIEQAAEGAARFIHAGYRRLKLQPHRTALRAEEKAIKKNVNALYERSMRQNPELRKANPLKKALHKRKIKRDYAKQFRQTQTTAQKAKRTAARAKEVTRRTVIFVKRHWKSC